MFQSVEGDRLIIRAHHCSAEFLRKMAKLREEGLYVDVRIKVRDVDVAGNEARKRDQDDAPKIDGIDVIKCHENGVVHQEEEEDAKKRHEIDVDSDENVITAHKLVLSCCSPYFEAMFSNKFKDNGDITVVLRPFTPI